MKWIQLVPHNHLLLDSAPNIGLLISRWELDKFKNCWNKSLRTSKILTLLYQQFSNLLISQRDIKSPRLGALSNNRWSGGSFLTLDSLSSVIFSASCCRINPRFTAGNPTVVWNCHATCGKRPSSHLQSMEFNPQQLMDDPEDCFEVTPRVHVTTSNHNLALILKSFNGTFTPI
jgi:hypothetical protein